MIPLSFLLYICIYNPLCNHFTIHSDIVKVIKYSSVKAHILLILLKNCENIYVLFVRYLHERDYITYTDHLAVGNMVHVGLQPPPTEILKITVKNSLSWRHFHNFTCIFKRICSSSLFIYMYVHYFFLHTMLPVLHGITGKITLCCVQRNKKKWGFK